MLSRFCLFLTIIHKLLIQKYFLLFLLLIIRMLFFQVLLQCSFGIILFATKFTYKKFLGPCMEKHVAIQCFLSHVPFGVLGAAKLFCSFWSQIMFIFDVWDLVLGGAESLFAFGAPKGDFKECFSPYASNQALAIITIWLLVLAKLTRSYDTMMSMDVKVLRPEVLSGGTVVFALCATTITFVYFVFVYTRNMQRQFILCVER